MDQNFINEMRERLVQDKKKLEESLATVSKEDKAGRFPGDAEAKFPDYGSSEEENTDEVITYQENLSTSSNLEELLDKTQAALERTDQGTYGVCTRCKLEIGEDRLRAFPAAETCVDCSKKS